MFQIAKAKPAILFFNRQAVQAKFAHCRPKLVSGEPILSIDLCRKRGDLVGRKAVGGFADHFRIFAKREVKCGKVAHHQANALRRLRLQPFMVCPSKAGVPKQSALAASNNRC